MSAVDASIRLQKLFARCHQSSEEDVHFCLKPKVYELLYVLLVLVTFKEFSLCQLYRKMHEEWLTLTYVCYNRSSKNAIQRCSHSGIVKYNRASNSRYQNSACVVGCCGCTGLVVGSCTCACRRSRTSRPPTRTNATQKILSLGILRRSTQYGTYNVPVHSMIMSKL